jgi:hypothetical protein
MVVDLMDVPDLAAMTEEEFLQYLQRMMARPPHIITISIDVWARPEE